MFNLITLLSGILWLTLFWIVANLHIVVGSIFTVAQGMPIWVANALKIGGPIIFGLIWIFIEQECLGPIVKYIKKVVAEGIEENPTRTKKGIRWILKAFYLGIVIFLIIICFYIYQEFLARGEVLG